MSSATLSSDPRVAPDRNRVVDLVRVTAISGVVVGHWLKQGWYVEGGELHRAGLLGIAPWTHSLTWVFQVMPLFFLVGGYVNALSWRHARARGVDYGAWLATRVGRLTRPVLPLLAFWCVAVPAAPFLGLRDNDWLRIASVTSLTVLWFLAVYLVLVALVPVTLGAWRRWGLWTLAPGLAALAIDAWSIHLGSVLAGSPNLLLVWGTLHQAGYAWRDGAVRGRVTAALLASGALLVAVGLVVVGPYGVSMVGVEGYGVNNTAPPRATVLFLGLGLAGLVLTLEPLLQRAAARPRVWWAVVVVERRLMTVYLWHLVALGLLGAVSLHLGGVGLGALPATREWWILQPAWLLALSVTTVALAWLVGRFEDPVAATRRPAWVPVLEVALAAVLLGVLADQGLGGTGPATARWLLAVIALVALGGLDSRLRQAHLTTDRRRRRDHWHRRRTFAPREAGRHTTTVVDGHSTAHARRR